jgi:hypothetical protein
MIESSPRLGFLRGGKRYLGGIMRREWRSRGIFLRGHMLPRHIHIFLKKKIRLPLIQVKDGTYAKFQALPVARLQIFAGARQNLADYLFRC